MKAYKHVHDWTQTRIRVMQTEAQSIACVVRALARSARTLSCALRRQWG